jgi:signal transduction histidine kinase
LCIVKALVEMHDGRVKVESTLNQGTIFAVSLPIAPQAVA